jgi:hypothetical protein
VVVRYIEEVINNGRRELIDELFAPERAADVLAKLGALLGYPLATE